MKSILVVPLCTLVLGISVFANAAESLIANGATLKKLHGDFEFIEGPVADPEGNVYFSDIPANKTYIWTVDGELKLFREDTGGANGLNFDADGNLYFCEGTVQRVTMMDKDGKLTTIVDKYKGKRLNSPNDLWFDAKGGFYLTDPRYQFFTHPVEQDGEHVYYISPDRKSITRVTHDVQKPNGVVGSLDFKTLYVASTSGKIFSFDINADATLSNKKEFANLGSDGVTLDEKGNLYLTWVGGVHVYNPKGEKIEMIKVPEMPANCGFGGKDGKTLFMTSRTGLYAIDMNVHGYNTIK